MHLPQIWFIRVCAGDVEMLNGGTAMGVAFHTFADDEANALLSWFAE
jgi:hypothetical protein